jgi:thiol-disulfide isomerase/thioredoxin
MPEFCSMKLLRILVLLLLPALPGFAQTAAKDSLPYQKYPTLPAFMLQNLDSTSFFNMFDVRADRPTVLFFFAPDCDHCHMTTKELLASMDSMKNADFYWFSYMPLVSIRPFVDEYKLLSYPNIRAGRDHTFFFMKFYGASTVPYLVIYDKKKKLVKLYDGAIKVPEIVRILRELK